MLDPDLDALEAKVGSKYALVVAVAKRAEQLKDGAKPLVDCKSKNPITIALHEIAQKEVLVGQEEQPEQEQVQEQPEAQQPEGEQELDVDLDIDLDSVLGAGDN